jgi:nitrogen fixation NifU-like protein
MTASYPEGFLDHFRRPRHVGRLDPCDRAWENQSPHCADLIRFSVRLGGGRVEAIRFQARGCSVCIAAASAAAEGVQGRALAELVRDDGAFLMAVLGPVPARKRRCVAFVWESLLAGLRT